MSAPVSTPILSAAPALHAPRTSLMGLLAWGVLLALLAGSWQGADMRPFDLVRDAGNMATYAADFFPPKFGDWRLYLQEMIVTVQIALWERPWPWCLRCRWACCHRPTSHPGGFTSRSGA